MAGDAEIAKKDTSANAKAEPALEEKAAAAAAAANGGDSDVDSKTDYVELRESLRNSFFKRHMSGESSYGWRIGQLKALRKMVTENEDRWTEAIQKDLGRDKRESLVLEITQVLLEVDTMITNLKNWMKPEKQPGHLLTQPASSYLYPEPLGVALIISPWNYPVSLLLMPLAGAIAAGNNALIKPSEVTENVGNLFAELIPKYLDQDCFPVRVAHVEETTRILEQKWDMIFFTGSTFVGKIVAKAAAKYLTPMVLELGGKSPAWVSKDCDLPTTARRIIWGKLANCGQTCVAPDYVLVHPDIEDALIKEMKKYADEMYGENPKEGETYSRMINKRRIEQLIRLLKDDGTKAGEKPKFKVEFGGLDGIDMAERYIPPTVLRDVDPEAAIMQEEIFGPILPIMKCESVDKAIEFINDRPKPLALYAFSTNQKDTEKILRQTSSGGVCVNDTIMQVASPLLRFGGVGESGQGSYHGRHTFEAFTHLKPVLWKTVTALESKNPRYPPFTDAKANQARRLIQMSSSCTIL